MVQRIENVHVSPARHGFSYMQWPTLGNIKTRRRTNRRQRPWREKRESRRHRSKPGVWNPHPGLDPGSPWVWARSVRAGPYMIRPYGKTRTDIKAKIEPFLKKTTLKTNKILILLNKKNSHSIWVPQHDRILYTTRAHMIIFYTSPPPHASSHKKSTHGPCVLFHLSQKHPSG